ncbi:hypothetical protein L3Q82_020641 [Scortum barcoo]|uniref:Uncharacterized protein n=1 Tax=Scortum barcoo TaxID=214431 RepID=A0ACB8V987_9TELE|nr:hypothetical protein L3Q82_020641 [Scortum barcoo]
MLKTPPQSKPVQFWWLVLSCRSEVYGQEIRSHRDVVRHAQVWSCNSLVCSRDVTVNLIQEFWSEDWVVEAPRHDCYPNHPFLKRGPESVFQLQRDHTSQPPREGLCQGTGEENSADSRPSDSGGTNNAVFVPGRGTLDQLYTLHRVLEGLWEFAQPVHMCFVDLEKAFDRVPRGILWGVLRAERSPVWEPQDFIRFMLFADDVVLLASSSQDLQRVLERFAAAECEAAGMRISTSKS